MTRIESAIGMDWSWAENVAEALAAIALGYGGRAGRDWLASRRGPLSGHWLWITYDKKDKDVWSIEIVRLNHRKTRKEEHLTGVVWRVYDRSRPCHWNRRWAFIGWHTDSVIEGVYKWTRDEAGSHGVIHVWRTEAGFDGVYVRLIREHHPDGTLFTKRNEAPTEWRRLPKTLPQCLQDIVKHIPLDEARENYPWRIREKLGIRPGRVAGFIGGLPYAGAVVDNRLMLEQAREEMRLQQEQEQKPGLPNTPLTRDDLKLYNP